MRNETPSQTAGPYVHIGCTPNAAGIPDVYAEDAGSSLPATANGTKIRLEGRVYDGDGQPVRDAMIELWQSDGEGKSGIWLRQPTDLSTGFYQFDTVKPRPSGSAPHICLWITARGINLGLHTRAYFPDEDNASDPVIASAGARAGTLIASRPDEEEDERDVGFPVYRFDIRLQGERETVFLDI